MQDRVEDLCLLERVADGRGHQDHQNGGQNARDPAQEGLAESLALQTGERRRYKTCQQEHQRDRDHRVVLQRPDHRGQQDDQDTGAEDDDKGFQSFIHGRIGALSGGLCTRIHRPFDAFGVAPHEPQQQAEDQHETQGPQPDAGEHRQPRQALRDADGERIHHAGRETAADGQQAHGHARDRVPAQAHRKRDHNGYERHDLLERADQSAHGHKEQDDDREQPVPAAAVAVRDAVEQAVHDAASVQAVERAADHEQKDDDRDQSAAPAAGQHEERRQQPLPERQFRIDGTVTARRVDHSLPRFVLDAREFARRDDERQKIG